MSTSTTQGETKNSTKQVPFGGYYQRSVPEPDAEIMRTGPGTPLGEFLRRFWLPVCLSEQVSDLPLAIRIMSEDLVVFRNKEGRIGLLNRHCSHRGASLEYGIVEEKGLRCCYHGWLFGNDGTLLEAPSEPPNSPIVGSLCQGAYPAFERSGLVFAYMGPPDLKPEFEENEFYGRPGNELVPYSNYFGCNWLQVQENIADPYHTSIFHNGVGNAALRERGHASTSLPAAWSELPVMDYRETESGAGMIYIVIGVNYLGRSASIILAGERRGCCFRYSVSRSSSFRLRRAVGKSRTPQGLSTGLPCGQVACPRRLPRQATTSRVLEG